jgi:hypothetical protein
MVRPLGSTDWSKPKRSTKLRQATRGGFPGSCRLHEISDPVFQYIFGIFPEAEYTAGLLELRDRYVRTGRYATYYLDGFNILFHQHTFRPRFYDPAASPNGVSIADWTSAFLRRELQQVGP